MRPLAVLVLAFSIGPVSAASCDGIAALALPAAKITIAQS